MMVKPNRVGWNEALRKADYAGTIASRFLDQPACLLYGSFPIEENGGCLYSGNAHSPE